MSKNKVSNLESDSDSDCDSIQDSESETISSVDVGIVDEVILNELEPDEICLDRILVKSPFFPSKIGILKEL